MADESSFEEQERYQIVLSLHKIEKLIEELPQTIATAVDKALNEVIDNLPEHPEEEVL